mgnify:CR=1 FL=1
MKVNLTTKNSKSYVDYIQPTKEIYNVGKNETSNISVFHKENIQQEVEKLKVKDQKEKRRLKKLIQVAQASTSSFIVAIPVSAQTPEVAKELPPPEQLMELAQWAIGYATISIIAAGIIWVVITRVLHFLPIEKYKKMALDIATNTIKGITEALLIPTIIGIIIGIAFLLFGGIPVFNLPL